MRIFLIAGASVGVIGTMARIRPRPRVRRRTSKPSAVGSKASPAPTCSPPRSTFRLASARRCRSGRSHNGCCADGLSGSRSWRRSIQAGGRPASIRRRHSAMSDQAARPPVLALEGLHRPDVLARANATLDVLTARADLDDARRRSRRPWSARPGAGKSTLLHISPVCSKRPAAGDVRIDGQSCIGLGDDDERTTGPPLQSSALSISTTTCSRNSRRWRTSLIPQIVAGLDQVAPRKALGPT